MRGYRVARHGGPEVLEWADLPRPEPGPDQALVRVRACALNHLDLWLRNGVEGHRFPLPLVPGSDIVGEVVETGALVDGFAPGDPVVVAPGHSCGVCDACVDGDDMLCPAYGILGEDRDGGYAEYAAVPGRNLMPFPAGLTWAEAAAVPLTFLTAWHMVMARAGLRPLEDVLVHAAGSGVSSAALQIARLAGARHLIATAGADEKLARATELGATHAVNYRRQDFVAEVRAITGKRGVDVVIDHVGGETFERSLRVLGRGGRLVLCGATSGALAQVHLRALFFKRLSILGSTMGRLAELRQVLRLVAAGRLRPVLDRTFPLEEAPAAQRLLESRGQFGKIVLTVGDGEERPGG